MNLHSSLIVVLMSFSLCLDPAHAEDPARWCTTSTLEQQECQAMKTAFSGAGLTPAIACVDAESKEECLSLIAYDRADLITVGGGEIYSGGRKFDILPIMEEVYAEGRTGYKAVPVVRKSNREVNFRNLRDMTTCHTGYGRSAGWNLPVGFLLEEGYMPALGCQSSLESASAYFNLSCVPGALEAAPEGADVTNLCALCDNPEQCSYSLGTYSSNFPAAFRCLVERDADVAFIKIATVLENTDGNNQDVWAASLSSDDFEVLCRDGTRRPIANSENCHTKAPSHAVVTAGTKTTEEIDSYIQLLTAAVDRFGSDDNPGGFSLFASDLLFKDDTEDLNRLDVDSYEDFLGEAFIESLDGLQACPADTLRFCTISDKEQEKCQAMRGAFAASSITPELSCYQSTSHEDCMVAISAGNADLVTLDSGEIYRAGKKYELVPVMSESISSSADDGSSWAVAVVKSSSTFTINKLEGKKSCHTGIMKTSGWIVPIGYLINEGKIDVTDCNAPGAVSDYFTESCVPGALEEEYIPAETDADSLCSLCNGGEDATFCVRNHEEPYYGNSGAFRCLVEGGGDVAFIEHLTVNETIDSAQPEQWSSSLNEADYSYLCPDGSRQVFWTEKCSLGKVPANALVTSAKANIGDIVDVFSRGQTDYGDDNSGSSTFKLFDSADFDGSDLLFRDSTNTLQSVGDKNTYDLYLTEEFIEDIEWVDPIACGSAMNGMSAVLLSAVLVIARTLLGGEA